MIGVFDSGVGGLSVLVEIRRALPGADLTYVADRARAPYGERQLDEVQDFSKEISGWLLDRGADTLVVACNTASAAALDTLRLEHPGIPIVGMEPAVKPATASTDTGVIVVFATAVTFQGRLFSSLVDRFGSTATVLTRACPEWVRLVEEGVVEGPAAEAVVAGPVTAALKSGADTLVLGCSHFSFLTGIIQRLAGPGITVIDPAPAVARQTARVAPVAVESGSLVLSASGDRSRFAELVSTLVGLSSGDIVPYP